MIAGAGVRPCGLGGQAGDVLRPVLAGAEKERADDNPRRPPRGAPRVGRRDRRLGQFHVRRLGLFGSAVTGGFDPQRSDLDLLVEFEPMPPGAYADAYFGLREQLEILFGRAIDLLTETALANPYLRRRIDAERQTLFPQP